MEQWKAAFKQIFGKTPTKQDCTIAPRAIRATLPVSPEKKSKNAPAIRKRKQLVLIPNEEKDEEFMSPEKKRRPKMPKTPTASASQKSETPKSTPTTSTRTSTSTPKPNDNQLQQLLRPPAAMEASFLSPVKQWKQFLASPSRSAQKMQERLAALVSSPTKLLKTPSPAKLLRRPIACINVGHLLTPEKPLFSSLEEQEEEDEHVENDATENTAEQAETDQQKENVQPTDTAKMEQPGTSKKAAKKPRKRKEPTANFVSINLRRRRFAPISKLQGAKKWKKFKGQWAKGGRRTMFGGR